MCLPPSQTHRHTFRCYAVCGFMLTVHLNACTEIHILNSTLGTLCLTQGQDRVYNGACVGFSVIYACTDVHLYRIQIKKPMNTHIQKSQYVTFGRSLVASGSHGQPVHNV